MRQFQNKVILIQEIYWKEPDGIWNSGSKICYNLHCMDDMWGASQSMTVVKHNSGKGKELRTEGMSWCFSLLVGCLCSKFDQNSPQIIQGLAWLRSGQKPWKDIVGIKAVFFTIWLCSTVTSKLVLYRYPEANVWKPSFLQRSLAQKNHPRPVFTLTSGSTIQILSG